jgi:hypothetical protein
VVFREHTFSPRPGAFLRASGNCWSAIGVARSCGLSAWRRIGGAHGVLNDRFENTFETATTVLGFLGKMPADAAYRIGHKPFQRLGLLNFSAPGISLTLRGSTTFTSAVCVFRAGFLADLSNTESELRFDEIDFLIDIESERLTYLGRTMLREAIQPGFASSVFTEAMGMAVALEIARYDSASRSDEGGAADSRCGRCVAWNPMFAIICRMT